MSNLLGFILLVLPFVVAGLLIAAGAHYVLALAIGFFLWLCIAHGVSD